MKKLLFLTALLTSLFLGFTACSESEDLLDSENSGHESMLYSIIGDMVYSQEKDQYFFKPDKFIYPNPYSALSDSAEKTVIGKEYEIVMDYSKILIANEDLTAIRNGAIKKVNIEISTADNYLLLILNKIQGEISGANEVEESRVIHVTADMNTPPPAWFFEPKSRAATYNLDGHYERINVFVHILRTTSGTTPMLKDNKETIMKDVVEALNIGYNQINKTNISFFALGCDEIDCLTSAFDINKDSDTDRIFIRNLKTDALNIYVMGDYTNHRNDGHITDGKAARVISNACIIHPDQYKGSVLSHEVGHCFGLYHTHRGTARLWNKYNSDTEEGVAEYVDSSNSLDAGDYIDDTPADPRMWTLLGDYTGNIYGIVDGHGEKYDPDPKNLMSYSGHVYRRELTSGQIDRIHETLAREGTVGNTAARHISPTETEMGGTGKLHFSERTKTLTFPVVADDEVVTWTISQRSSGGNATSQASPKVTTATGKSITITHNSLSDYFEVYATTITPYGTERKSKVWKATAGVPSAAVGTLSWTGGDGTSGSFPGYSPTLTLNNYDTSLDLKYTDLANPTYRSGVTYRLYTSAGGMMESSYGDFCISEMDCSRGYVEVQAVDNCCGADGIRWRIECQSRWDIFSLDIKDGQLMIDVKPATAQVSAAEKTSAKRNLTIKSIKLTTPEGRELVGRTLDTPQPKMSLSTAGMPKGQYLIEITDVDGKVHKGHFGI